LKITRLSFASAALMIVAQAQSLPGTAPLTSSGDLTLEMLRGIDRFLMRQTEASLQARRKYWTPDFASPAAYQRSVERNRQDLRRIIGLIDARLPVRTLQFESATAAQSVVAEGTGYRAYAVRWPVLDGVSAEGLLLEPAGPVRANIIALPDADWTPEMLAGITSGLSVQAQFARRLAENGCRVLIPTLINREDTWSGQPGVAFSNQTHREFIYRMAYEVGRHIIGYEVQKVLAAVDWFQHIEPNHPIGVAGYGEGGLLALYAAAVDTRISSTMVSGYFDSRQNLWQEPLYRNVWGLLEEFGDAELASLIAPRSLIVEASRGPEISGPPAAEKGRAANAAPGRLVSPPLASVRKECERAEPIFEKLGSRMPLVVSGSGRGDPGSAAAMKAFKLALSGGGWTHERGGGSPRILTPVDPVARQHRQVLELIELSQRLADRSVNERRKFWAKADRSSVQAWQESTGVYRKYLWDDLFGRFQSPAEPLEARTRRHSESRLWSAYEVVLPVWNDVIAYGMLLIPKNVKPGERRPVVVCQHGVNDRIQKLIDPAHDNIYHHFATRLADMGFVVYLPQNPYVGEPEFPFRLFQRKANPLRRSIFSIILAQHERLLDWLATLPFVDERRIGFYGLSYGGETAVRVPPLLSRYAVAICSGNFNEWVHKTTDWNDRGTFLYMGGYDHYDFNLANTFDDADMASLMLPRPFMVERGHSDPVGTDEWVAYEYAKLRRLYDTIGFSTRTSIEYFNGVHEIHQTGTIEFLKRTLDWHAPADR
jgi:dienelactone hydrolase